MVLNESTVLSALIKNGRCLIGGKDYRYGLLLVYSRSDGINDLLSVPVLICDRLAYSVEQADCNQEGFSHVLRAPYDQECGGYEPCFCLGVLIGLHISSASHGECYCRW